MSDLGMTCPHADDALTVGLDEEIILVAVPSCGPSRPVVGAARRQ